MEWHHARLCQPEAAAAGSVYKRSIGEWRIHRLARQGAASTANTASTGLRELRVERNCQPDRTGQRHKLCVARRDLLLRQSDAGEFSDRARLRRRRTAGQCERSAATGSTRSSPLPCSRMPRCNRTSRSSAKIPAATWRTRTSRRSISSRRRTPRSAMRPQTVPRVFCNRVSPSTAKAPSSNRCWSRRSGVSPHYRAPASRSSAGVVRGTSQLSPASPPVRIGSALSSVVDGNGNSLYGERRSRALCWIRRSIIRQRPARLTTPVIPSAASEIALTGIPTNYGFTQPATATSLPNGVGANRTSQTLTGYFGGVINPSAPAQPYPITGTTSLSTDAAANRIAATLTSDPLTPSSTRGVSSIKMQFGPENSAFIDNNIYGAAESQISRPADLSTANPRRPPKLYFLSSGAAPPPTSLLPSGASYCQCQYLQWGYWGGDLDRQFGHRQHAARSIAATSTSGPPADHPAGRYELARLAGRHRHL